MNIVIGDRVMVTDGSSDGHTGVVIRKKAGAVRIKRDADGLEVDVSHYQKITNDRVVTEPVSEQGITFRATISIVTRPIYDENSAELTERVQMLIEEALGNDQHISKQVAVKLEITDAWIPDETSLRWEKE